MSITNDSFGVKTENEMAENPDSTTGDGGGVMDIWTADRTTVLRNLVGGGGDFENNSAFDLPAGVVDSTAGGFHTSFENNEVAQGVSATGTALDQDGLPLSGTAKIEAEGFVFSESTVSGSFRVAAPPPAGAFLGDNYELDDYDFRFSPSMPGLANFTENIPYTYDAGNFQYGKVTGQVLDYNGNPVENVAVAGKGSSDITDDLGEYGLIGPGGSTANLTTFYDSHTVGVDLTAGDTTTNDFVFPKLSIKVVDADYQPIEDAPVKIDGTVHRTGANGLVEIDDAELKDYEVSVMDTFDATLSVSEPGQLYQFTVGPGASFGENASLDVGGIKIEAVDANTGNGIRDLVARELTSGATSNSNDQGVCKLLTEATGEEIDVMVGTGDKRYLPGRIAGTVPEGEMLTISIELEPRTQVTNA